MWYYNSETGNFSVGFIPTTTVHHVNPDGTEYDVQGVQEEGWVQIADRPTPHDDYIFDGVNWVLKPIQPLTVSEQKRIGKAYNGYQIPLTKESQDTVVAVAVAFQMGGIALTVMEFENGTNMPIDASGFMAFATWFTTERNKFFIG